MGNNQRIIGPSIRRSAFATIAVLLAACSAGVSSPPSTPTPPGDPNRIEIQPPAAVAFSNTPTTFVITGGNGNYIVSSSNQGVLPLSGAISGNLLTVVPASVGAETPVTLTVRDTGTATIATATLTVRPRTVSSAVTVTPTDDTCEPAICSGADASVEVTLTEGGGPLVNRTVRFDVVSGDVRFITSPPGSSETLATSITTTSDLNGKARVRFRALAGAPTQTAILSATDVVSGSFVRTSVPINGAPSAPTIIPSEVTVTGPSQGTCPTEAADFNVFVFGGVPPYVISNTQPTALLVEPVVVASSGGFFRVRTLPGSCFVAQVVVSDSASQRSILTVRAVEGTTQSNTGSLVVAPEEVTLDSCQVTANVTIAGGLGPASYREPRSSHSGVMATLSPDRTFISIRRAPGITEVQTTPVTVSLSDGRSTATVTVNLVGAGLGRCNNPP